MKRHLGDRTKLSMSRRRTNRWRLKWSEWSGMNHFSLTLFTFLLLPISHFDLRLSSYDLLLLCSQLTQIPFVLFSFHIHFYLPHFPLCVLSHNKASRYERKLNRVRFYLLAGVWWVFRVRGYFLRLVDFWINVLH